MSTPVRIIIAVVVVAALAGGGYAAFHKSNSADSGSATNTTTNAPASQSPNANTNTSATAAATITFTGDMFTPSVTTVKAGSTVQVTNKSSLPLQFDSDPHPTHTDEPELNIDEVSPGQSKTFKVTKTGHWGFHDHLNPSITGTLDVE